MQSLYDAVYKIMAIHKDTVRSVDLWAHKRFCITIF